MSVCSRVNCSLPGGCAIGRRGLRQGLAPATIRQAFRVLSLVLSHAARSGRLARNPSDGWLCLGLTSRTSFLTHAQVAALADAAGPYGLAVQLMASSGLRFGELAALQ